MTLITLKSDGFIRRLEILSHTFPSKIREQELKIQYFYHRVKCNLTEKLLTSGDKGINVLDFTDGWMITIAHNVFNSVDQAIHVDYGFGILDLGHSVELGFEFFGF